MDDLVDQRRDQYAGRETSKDHARSHGREQWGAGYNFFELIWEIYIIRRVLVETALPDFCKTRPEWCGDEAERAERFVQEFFHRVRCESVTQFAHENE